MAKMKSPDFKALFLKHGEKFGAAFVSLLALTGLATASWKPAEEDTENLIAIATDTQAQWKRSPWSEEGRKAFADTPKVEEMAQRMASPNEDIGQFATNRHWNPPINELQKKLGVVTVLAPETPESSLVRFTMAEKPDEEAATEEDPKPEDKPEEAPASNKDFEDLLGSAGAGGIPGGDSISGGELGSGGAGQGGGLGGAGLGGAGLGMNAGGGGLGGGPGGRRMGGGGIGGGGIGGGSGMPPGGGMGAGRSSGMGMGGGMGAGGMGMGMGMGMGEDNLDLGGESGYGIGLSGAVEKKKVRSCTGVSARWVFDLYKQQQTLAGSLHMSAQQAGRYIDFVNLQIERKPAIPGIDPWAGEWEPLPLKDLGELLMKSLGLDREIVNPSVVRSEITMPLLRRAAGVWTPADASHKRLEKFELSPEEQEIIDRHQAKMKEEAEKRKANLPPDQPKSEGFRSFLLNSGDLGMALGGSAAYGSAGDVAGDMFENSGESEEPGAPGAKNGTSSRFQNKEEMETFLKNTLVANRLLLVRFMDFTCDRGNAYQYRVRLEMRNPNFNMPVDELEQPELAAQPTIFSDWSEPTKPVFVPDAYRYYTQKVEGKPRADELALLAMYYEHETAGTPVMTNLRVPVGARIGGKQLIEVVDLGKSSLESQEVEFRSRDFLTSVSEAPKISQGDNPELKPYFKSLTPGVRPLGDRMTVIDANGAIVARVVGDKVANGDKVIAEGDDKAFTDFVIKHYDYLRPQEEGEVGSGDPYAGGAGGMADGAGGMGAGGLGMGGYGGGMSSGSSMSGNGSGRRSGRGGRGSGRGAGGGFGGGGIDP